MNFNSKILGVLSLFFVLAVLVGSAGAANSNYVNHDFNNFEMHVPAESDFSEDVSTNFNFGDVGFDMDIFENKGNYSQEFNSVMYFKDHSSNHSMIKDLTDDLKKDGEVIEEGDDYFVVKTQNSPDWDFFNFNIGDDINALWNFASGIFSSGVDMNVSTNGSDIKIDNEGINIVDSEGNVSLSGNGLDISDANGQNVSFSSEGVNISGDDSSNESVNVEAENLDMDSNIQDSDYVFCILCPGGDSVIMLCGDDLDLIKNMADSTSLKEN